jgi:hypothetical protein
MCFYGYFGLNAVAPTIRVELSKLVGTFRILWGMLGSYIYLVSPEAYHCILMDQFSKSLAFIDSGQFP